MEKIHKAMSKEECVELIKKKSKILLITGAGASADSGIPTFRGSSNSYWKGKFGAFIALFFANIRGWTVFPTFCWMVVNQFFRIPILKAKPNDCHIYFGRLSKNPKVWLRIITQNVDGLHQYAGIPYEHVAEIHGTVRRVKCMYCDHLFCDIHPDEHYALKGSEYYPTGKCPTHGYYPRPDVTFFGESCPFDEGRKASSFIEQLSIEENDQEIVVIIGTSGMINTIGYYLGWCESLKKTIVLIDPNPTGIMIKYADFVVRARAAEVFL